jgi:hypothetical protein
MAKIINADMDLASANIERQLPELIGAATKGLITIGPTMIIVDGLINPREQHRPLPFSNQQAMDHLYGVVLRVHHEISFPVPVNAIFRALMQPSPKFTSSFAHSIRSAPPKPARSPLGVLEELDGIVETGHDQEGLPLFRLQPYFQGFITNPRRCGAGFHVDRSLPVAYSLAELCLDEMNHTLTHNICQLDDLMVLDEEILDLKEDLIRQFIPGTLRYACCQWISHLELARDIGMVSPVIPKIKKFLFAHLLHWFEVMSMLGYFRLILPSLERLAAWFKVID